METESGRVGQFASEGQLLRGKVGADVHVGSTTRAAPGGWLGVGDARIGSRLPGELKASECEQSGSVSTGEIAEVSDTDETTGENMLAKAAQELGSSESHDALFIAVGVVFPSEAHVVTIEAKQALIADGHAVGISAEIAQHVARSTKRRLGIDHPLMF
jgi:hypothetical protein